MSKKIETRIDYYPRRGSFWKFWEKRQASRIATWTKDGDRSQEEITYFLEDGSKAKHIVNLTKGGIISYTSEDYYPNGQICRQYSSDPYIEKVFYENGRLEKVITSDTETRYFESGKVKSVRTNTSQENVAEYVEYTEEGILKKKGYVYAPLGFSGPLHFRTGNMEEKRKDGLRQKLNVTIDSLNRNMPATEERKIAKREIVKAYRKSKTFVRE